MRDPVRSEERNFVERRAFVDEASILGADKHVASNVQVGSAAIYERRPGLGRGERTICGGESQTTNAGLNKRGDSPHGKAEHVGSSPFMLICVDTRRSRAKVIPRAGSRICVVGFYAVMRGEEKAVAGEDATAIGTRLADTVLGGAVDKRSDELCRHLGPPCFFALYCAATAFLRIVLLTEPLKGNRLIPMLVLTYTS